MWAYPISGQGETEGTGIAADESGNIYVTGFIKGAADFDVSQEAYVLDAGDIFRNFILKLDADGQLVWARLTGRIGFPSRSQIDLNADGHLLITGIFNGSVDFDPGPGNVTFSSLGSYDSFVISLDTDGNLNWAKTITGNETELINDFELDHEGNLLITGGFSGHADFDPGPDQNLVTATSDLNGFVLKLNGDGTLNWVKAFTGTGKTSATRIKTSQSGIIYVAATLSGTIDFNPGTTVNNLTKEGPEAMVLVKLSNTGEFENAVSFGENDYFNFPILAIDNHSNIYVTGSFTGSSDFDPGPANVTLTSTGITDLFYAVFDNQLNLLSAVHCPGQRVAACRAVIITTNGAVLSTGFFERTVDFDPGTADYSLTSPTNNADIFLLKLNSSVSAAKDHPVIPGLAIFPNPAQDHLFIDVPESSDPVVVEIVDSRGNILSVRNIENQLTQSPVELQTGHLNAGNYIVRLTTKAWIYSGKLVIINN